jgi:hypothetical protein
MGSSDVMESYGRHELTSRDEPIHRIVESERKETAQGEVANFRSSEVLECFLQDKIDATEDGRVYTAS